jgi:hypothetical protein
VTQLHEARAECVCGDHIGARSGSQHRIPGIILDFWKLHSLCKQGDEKLSEFEKKVMAMFPEDDDRVWSQKYEYVLRRTRALNGEYSHDFLYGDL